MLSDVIFFFCRFWYFLSFFFVSVVFLFCLWCYVVVVCLMVLFCGGVVVVLLLCHRDIDIAAAGCCRGVACIVHRF